ncbi:MAG: UvrB/UvrC motif-containing protein [Novosphingobium sp.]
MSATTEDLERRMAAAAEAMDFEEARRLRDAINLIRSGASAEDATRADTSGLARQKAGAMGIGTSQPKPVTPPGWKRRPKPDPMTRGRSRRR